jgi:hypothetical protein
MRGGAENDEFVVDPRFENQIRVARLALDQADVQLVAMQALDHLPGVADAQGDPAARILLQVFDDDQRRQVIADGQRRPDGDRGEFAAGQVAFDLAGPGQHVLGLGQQTAAVAVEAQRLAQAVEQRAVEMALQFEQGRARRRLRHVELRRRARHVFQTGDGNEDFELAQGDFHI